MAELITVARPYAEAVFQLAKETGRLSQWAEVLAFLSMAVAEEQVCVVINNPDRSSEEKQALLVSLIGDRADAEVKNFLALLAENHRLILVSEIASQFELLKKEEEGVLDVIVTSAFPLTEAQESELAETLKKKYGKNIVLSSQVDQDLIGGVCLRVGDDVIDASVRGKLNAMAVSLKS